MAHFQLFDKVYFNGCALLLVDVDVVQEEQERQFHRQHISFDAHGPNLLPEMEIKAPEAFRASERVKVLLRLTNDSGAEKGALRS